jgi:hypothetical protein
MKARDKMRHINYVQYFGCNIVGHHGDTADVEVTRTTGSDTGVMQIPLGCLCHPKSPRGGSRDSFRPITGVLMLEAGHDDWWPACYFSSAAATVRACSKSL